MIYALLLLAIAAILWPAFVKRTLKYIATGAACIIALAVIIAALPGPPKTGDARTQLISAYVSAYVDQDRASMAEIRTCNDVDADDNVSLGDSAKKFTQECKDATYLERSENERLRAARAAIIPPITEQEECAAKEDYLKARGVDSHLCKT